MTVEVPDGMPDTLTYEQAMKLAAQNPSGFKFPNQMLSFDELVKQQMQLKEQSERQLLKEG